MLDFFSILLGGTRMHFDKYIIYEHILFYVDLSMTILVSHKYSR